MGIRVSGADRANEPASSGPFFVYIVRCSDDSLYVGHTRDVDARVQLHNDGRGAHWTANRRPVRLVYQEPQPSRQKAVARERQLKRWTHAKKLALINGDRTALKSLARRRTAQDLRDFFSLEIRPRSLVILQPLDDKPLSAVTVA
jgi:putative endonuclease